MIPRILTIFALAAAAALPALAEPTVLGDILDKFEGSKFGSRFGVSQSQSSSCSRNEIFYSERNCCVSTTPSKTSPPSGKTCPSSGWYWHSGQSCCVPSTPSYPSTPSCPSGHGWDKGESCCTPSTPSKPTTTSKPATTSAAPPATTSPSSTCNSGNFPWFGLKGDCCLPHGGQPSPPSPPSGSSCPSTWNWHSGQGCCVPSHPSPPPPTCQSGHSWNGSKQCCNPSNPQPSGGYSHYNRKVNKRAVGLCPVGLEACPIGGLVGLTADYECIDTARELQSCGGCASLHSEMDCTAIEGSWNVGCERGACKVYSCMSGYKLSSDHASCEKL